MRKLVVLSLILMFFCSPLMNPTAVYASGEETRVIVNGSSLHLDASPVNVGGRLLVPLRAIFEALGGYVEWDAATGTVRGTKGAANIELHPYNDIAYVNGKSTALDVPAQIINNRTMVPLRFVEENLGAAVSWDPQTKTVNITYGTPPAAKTVRIGLNIALTGIIAPFGQSVHNGVLLAAKEINAGGGTNGAALEFITLDNQSEIGTAVLNTQELISKFALAMIGPETSTYYFHASLEDELYKVPMITPAGTSDDITLTDTGSVREYSFRTCFADSYQGDLLAAFTVNGLNAFTAATIYDQAGVYPKSVEQSFTAAYKEKGGRIISSNPYYSMKSTDFKDLLTKIIASDPSVILLTGYDEEIALIIKQARELGYVKPIVGGDSFDSDTLINIAGAASLKNVFFVNHFSFEDKDPQTAAFVGKYRLEYHEMPDALAALGYDTVYLLAEAIANANSFDADRINQALSGVENYAGAAGIIYSFDSFHNPIKSGVIITFDQTGRQSFSQRITP